MNIKSALRALARTPVVSFVVIISLALGIGCNTAIFSLMDQILLRSLPVNEPDRLVLLNSPGEFKSGRQSTNDSGDTDFVFSYPVFRRLESAEQDAVRLAGFRQIGMNVNYESTTISSSGLAVSGSYFQVLGVRPFLGRTLQPMDDVDGQGNMVAMVSHRYWQDRMGADPEALNKIIRVNGHALTIVGVTPPGFNGTTTGNTPSVYLPLAVKPLMTPGWDGTDNWNDYWLYLVGRMAPGVTMEQAQSALNVSYAPVLEEMVAQAQRSDEDYLSRYASSRLTLLDGSHGNSGMREGSELPLIILMVATVLVLLIAMANAANLLLARTTQRRRELAVRVALGAGRRHLIVQMLSEAMLLALASGAVGILFGQWTLSALIGWISSSAGEESTFLSTGLQWPVLLFAIGISVVVGLLMGLYPALEASRRDVTRTLRDGSGKASASRGSARLRKGLVVAQVTISILLLVPTGLFLKSLVNLIQVDLGFDTGNLVQFGVYPALNGYEGEDLRNLLLRIEDELKAIPGATSVSSTLVPLIAGNNWGTSLIVEGYPTGPDVDRHSRYNEINEGFFSQMGTPLLAGREFTEADRFGSANVAVVNETFARHFFNGENPVGKHFGTGGGDDPMDIEIVGYVRDTHYSQVKEEEPTRLFYTPWKQDTDLNWGLYYYVRSPLPTEQIVSSMRSVMTSVDRDLPMENLRTFEAQVKDNITADRIVLQLSAVFAILATVLAMLGLYGVMAYSVAQRVREIGIRMALGAGPILIRGMVMREMLFILGFGLTLGVPIALVAARFAESQLYGVTAFDLPVIIGAIASLTAAAVAAGYLPARKATRVDPVESLRYE